MIPHGSGEYEKGFLSSDQDYDPWVLLARRRGTIFGRTQKQLDEHYLSILSAQHLARLLGLTPLQATRIGGLLSAKVALLQQM